MNKVKFLLVIAVIILGSSCARNYYSPEAKALAKKHQIIAITPPKVAIAARKKVSVEALKEQQKTESFYFQQEMYSWFMQRIMRKRVFMEIQNIETTNALLEKAGYFNGDPMTPAEICDLLGVDGVISSNYSLMRPMSEAGALAVGLLIGSWGPTKHTSINLAIHDKSTNRLLWNYNYEAAGTVGTSHSQLVDLLLRKASKRMPYSR